MTSQNIGRFRLPREMVRDTPDLVAEIFRLMKCVPVRAEDMFEGYIEYTAIAEGFPSVIRGTVPPKYELRITQNNPLPTVSTIEIVSRTGGRIIIWDAEPVHTVDNQSLNMKEIQKQT